MRCDDDVRRLQERTAVRLLDIHVDRCARDLARLERRDQRRLVHELAAGRVDDAHAVTHLRDRRGVDRVARVVGQRQVEGEKVCARQHFLEARAVDAELAKALCGDERVIGDDLHLQPHRPPRDLPADAPEAEHAEHLVGELDAAPLRALPPARRERCMGLRDVAREREEQADRVLGGRDDVRLGRVCDDDAAPRGRIDVHVVHADAGAADRPSRCVARAIRSAVTFVAERTIRPSYRSMISSSGDSVSTSTSKCSRRRSIPASAIFSRTSTRIIKR